MTDDPKPSQPATEDSKYLRERANELARQEGRPEPFPEPKQEGGTNWTALTAELRRDFAYTVIP
jgi:hypothetical protein